MDVLHPLSAGLIRGIHIDGRHQFTESLTLPPPDEKEQQFQELWRQFYKTLEIKARHNEKGRMTHCPKRFWADMTEMKEELK